MPEPPSAPGHVVSEATLLLQQFRELSDRFERRLSTELEVNATDYRAMEHLLRSGPLSAGELARRLGISGAATTTAIDRLVDRGHVQREADASDRRRVRVVPAETSSKRANDLVLPMVHDLDVELAAFSARDRDVITEYLRQVVDALRRHADGA